MGKDGSGGIYGGSTEEVRYKAVTPNEVWVVHIQSESSEDYYTTFKKEPTTEDILEFQREKYIYEYGKEPDSIYFTDLMGLRSCVKVKLK